MEFVELVNEGGSNRPTCGAMQRLRQLLQSVCMSARVPLSAGSEGFDLRGWQREEVLLAAIMLVSIIAM